MALKEKELEKKHLTEICSLVQGYEQKVKDIAQNIGIGLAKPTDMLVLNSDLALLKKVRDKKMSEQNAHVPHGHPKAAAPLKSYEDYVSNKQKNKKK